MCKLVVKHEPEKCTAQLQIARLRQVLLTKYAALPADRVLVFRYLDHDVGVHADLDEDTWEEFVAQENKSLQVSIGPEIESSVAPSTVESEPIQELEPLQESEPVTDSVPAVDEEAVVVTETVVHDCEDAVCDAAAGPRSDGVVDDEPSRPIVGSHIHSINSVKVAGLEKEFVVSLLKQQQRPMTMEFVLESVDSMAGATHSLPSAPGTPAQSVDRTASTSSTGVSSMSGVSPSVRTGRSRKAVTKISFDMFSGKYGHSLAESLRRKVDKWMEEYTHGDWAGLASDSRAPSTSERSSSAASSKRSQSNSTCGDGTVLTPGQFIISIYRFMRQRLEKQGLFDNGLPQGGGMPTMGEEQWDDIMDHIEAMVCSRIFEFTIAVLAPKYREDGGVLNDKLSRLKFISLEHLGLYATVSPNFRKALEDGEEPPPFPSHFAAEKSPYYASLALLSEQEEWRLAMKQLCRSGSHDNPHDIMKRFVAASNIIAHATEAYLTNGCLEAVAPVVPTLARQNSTGFLKQSTTVETRSLSADELLPAIAWTVIQANPPDLDYLLWFCEEFRHPDRMHGETAYALAQLSSAVSFCLSIEGADALDMSPDDFSCFVMQHDLTQELFSACRKGNLDLIKACLGGSSDSGVRMCADINGLDPTQKDRPLSCCVRNQQLEAAKLLLSMADDGIKVNARISPCQGGAEGGYTMLHLAAISGQLDMVVMLLLHGADRYLLDDKGLTPLALAVTSEHKAVVNVLLADPKYSSLIDHVRGNNILLVEGLIRQAADVNALSEDGTSFALLEAVRTGNLRMLKFIIKNGASLKINQTNCFDETALMYLAFVDASGLFPADVPIDYESLLTSLATTLLEGGAKRSLRSQFCGTAAAASGKSALDCCRGELVKWQNSMSGGGGGSHPNGGSGNSAEENHVHARELPGRDIASYVRGLVAVINIIKYDPDEYQIYEVARLKLPEAVQALCEQGVEMNTPDPAKGYTALIAAVFNEDIDMIKLLMRYGCASLRTPLPKSAGVGKSKSKAKAPLVPEPSPPRLNINRPGRNGMRALHYAAQCGNAAICGVLLEYGADRRLTNDQDHTALNVATVNGHNEAANVLRYDPAEVPISLAAKHGDWVVLKSLLYQGIGINTIHTHYEKDTNNTIVCHELATVLIAAVAYGQDELFKNLMGGREVRAYVHDQLQVDVRNVRGETALMLAAARGSESMVLSLLRRGADRHLRDTGARTALDMAKAGGHSAGLLHVLQYDPREVWLHDVIRAKDFRAVVALLKQRVDVNVRRFRDSKTPNSEMDSETTTKQPRQPEVCSSGGGQTTSSNKTGAGVVDAVPVTDGELPFTVAAACNCVEIISLFLKCPDLDINRADGLGRSALFHAAMNGHESAVVLLLKNKANRKATDFTRQTALDVAIAGGHLQAAALLQADPATVHVHDMCTEGKVLMVNALLLQGCPVNYKDERSGMNMQTPLLAACAAGKMDVAKLLLSQPNILLDTPDTTGRTPLMAAAGVGALNITSLLLGGGCYRDAVDNDGKTAKDYAYSHGIGTRMTFMSQQMMY